MGLGTEPIFLRLAPDEEALAGPRPFSIGRFYLAPGPFPFLCRRSIWAGSTRGACYIGAQGLTWARVFKVGTVYEQSGHHAQAPQYLFTRTKPTIKLFFKLFIKI